MLGQIPARELPTSLIYTLHDDNVGLLPQLSTGSLDEITKDLRRYGWSGFSTRYWLLGDHEPCVAYLARAAWDAAATPSRSTAINSARLAARRAIDDMLTVFREVEAATVQLEWHGLGFAFPVPGMIMKHWQPAATAAGTRRGERALPAGAGGRETGPAKESRRGGRATSTTGLAGWSSGSATSKPSTRFARRPAPRPTRSRRKRSVHAEAALKNARAALEAYARVAVDQSDRGAIAIMAEYVYRPLKEKVAQLHR